MMMITRYAKNKVFSIKDFFSKCDQIRSFLRIWSHLLKKSLMENFMFLCSGNDVDDVKSGLICNMIKLRMTRSIYTFRRNSTRLFRMVLRINNHYNMENLKMFS